MICILLIVVPSVFGFGKRVIYRYLIRNKYSAIIFASETNRNNRLINLRYLLCWRMQLAIQSNMLTCYAGSLEIPWSTVLWNILSLIHPVLSLDCGFRLQSGQK